MLLQYESWDELARRRAKRGDSFTFFSIHCCQISKKIERGPFGLKKNFEKISMPKKKLKGPLVSPGIVCYAEKEKPFWFSSLGQMIQFGTIKFRRTFKKYFGQFVWIEKSHYNSRVSLHEAPTKNDVLNCQ